MRLLITSPTTIIADHADVTSLRAEDESGGFGILDGHAELLTVLTVSVVSWRHADGRAGYCAVRRGALSVQGGNEVIIATREAQLGNDLEALETSVLARFRAETEAERTGRVAAARLHTQAIRRIVEALWPEHQGSSTRDRRTERVTQVGAPAAGPAPGLATRRRALIRALPRAGGCAWLDHRRPNIARSVFGPVGRSSSWDRNFLDRSPAGAWSRLGLLVRLAMDARQVMSGAGFLAFGLAVGTLHFLVLRWTVALYLQPGPVWAAAVAQGLRLGGLAGLLVIPALQGALPLLFAALGLLIARLLVVRWLAVVP